MVSEQMIFQAMLQIAQHGIYQKGQNPDEALAEAKIIVDKMIQDSKEIAQKYNDAV